MDFDIIEAVQGFPHLYDKRHINYKNKTAMDNGWTSIAIKLNSTKEFVCGRWQNIRNRYARERKRIKCMPSGSGSYNIWPLYEPCSFLEEFVCERRRASNISCSSVPSELEEDNIQGESYQSQYLDPETGLIVEIQTDESLPPELSSSILPATESKPSTSSFTPIPISSTSSEARSTAASRAKAGSKKGNATDELMKTISAAIRMNENDEDDTEDMLFARSIGKALVRMKSEQKKGELKVAIMQLLCDYSKDQ